MPVTNAINVYLMYIPVLNRVDLKQNKTPISETGKPVNILLSPRPRVTEQILKPQQFFNRKICVFCKACHTEVQHLKGPMNIMAEQLS